ncbi:MAG: hypothetical protein JO218_05415 [Burkholderiales bacterium]|nr:hypothetical protein [Burkholderiales bacterium]
MKYLLMSVILAAGLACHAQAAETSQAAMSDKERIDALIRQNQALLEENQRLHLQCTAPKTKEEVFAQCMQAAKGETSPMAAESIGGHCDQLLHK